MTWGLGSDLVSLAPCLSDAIVMVGIFTSQLDPTTGLSIFAKVNKKRSNSFPSRQLENFFKLKNQLLSLEKSYDCANVFSRTMFFNSWSRISKKLEALFLWSCCWSCGCLVTLRSWVRILPIYNTFSQLPSA